MSQLAAQRQLEKGGQRWDEYHGDQYLEYRNSHPGRLGQPSHRRKGSLRERTNLYISGGFRLMFSLEELKSVYPLHGGRVVGSIRQALWYA